MIFRVHSSKFFLFSPNFLKIVHNILMIYNTRNQSNDTTESQKEKRPVLMLLQEENEI